MTAMGASGLASTQFTHPIHGTSLLAFLFTFFGLHLSALTMAIPSQLFTHPLLKGSEVAE